MRGWRGVGGGKGAQRGGFVGGLTSAAAGGRGGRMVEPGGKGEIKAGPVAGLPGAGAASALLRGRGRRCGCVGTCGGIGG